MLHTNNPIIKHKAGLLNLASELQNVSKACKIMGVSRDTFYRYQELVETDGLDGLIDHTFSPCFVLSIVNPFGFQTSKKRSVTALSK